MLEEYDTWSQIFDQTFEVLLNAARLSELPTHWSNSCQRKRVKSVLTIRLLLNSEQSQTDLRRFRRTSIQRQYCLASFIKCCRIFNTIPTTVSLKSVASDISTLLSRERDVDFSKWPIAGYPSESEHWSTKVIRQSGIQSLNTRRE